MNLPGHQPLSEIVLIVGAPLLLAVVELFHPHPRDLLDLDVQTWLAVHYAQLPLFPLSALAVVALVRDRAGIAATLCRVAMFVFAISFTAFDTAAGVVTGILIKAAHKSGTPEAWRASIDAVWTHPIMGGSPLGPPPFLAVLGSVALSVGTVAAGLSLKRSGSSWAPVVLLALAGSGISVFRSHAWPGGPLTFGGLAMAGGWLLWERAQEGSANGDHSLRSS
jgi:uncharacterized membrane protein YqjE